MPKEFRSVSRMHVKKQETRAAAAAALCQRLSHAEACNLLKTAPCCLMLSEPAAANSPRGREA